MATLCTQIKPKVGTVCFGVAASQAAIILAGGEKGMRYAMPNARIMLNQPQSGSGVWVVLGFVVFSVWEIAWLSKVPMVNFHFMLGSCGRCETPSQRSSYISPCESLFPIVTYFKWQLNNLSAAFDLFSSAIQMSWSCHVCLLIWFSKSFKLWMSQDLFGRKI